MAERAPKVPMNIWFGFSFSDFWWFVFIFGDVLQPHEIKYYCNAQWLWFNHAKYTCDQRNFKKPSFVLQFFHRSKTGLCPKVRRWCQEGPSPVQQLPAPARPFQRVGGDWEWRAGGFGGAGEGERVTWRGVEGIQKDIHRIGLIIGGDWGEASWNRMWMDMVDMGRWTRTIWPNDAASPTAKHKCVDNLQGDSHGCLLPMIKWLGNVRDGAVTFAMDSSPYHEPTSFCCGIFAENCCRSYLIRSWWHRMVNIPMSSSELAYKVI